MSDRLRFQAAPGWLLALLAWLAPALALAQGGEAQANFHTLLRPLVWIAAVLLVLLIGLNSVGSRRTRSR
jgi:hypothetical protein